MAGPKGRDEQQPGPVTSDAPNQTDEDETTAEAATLDNPPHEDSVVVAEGPEPDMDLPAADAPAETVSDAPGESAVSGT